MIRGALSSVARQTAALLLLCGVTGCAVSRLPSETKEEVRQIVETATKQDERGEIGRSVKELKIALTIDPDNTRARAELNRLVSLQHKEAEQRFSTGISQRETNPQNAQKELLAALRLRPDYPEALEYLGEAYVKLGRLEHARRVLDRLEPLDAGRAAELADALRGAAIGTPSEHQKK